MDYEMHPVPLDMETAELDMETAERLLVRGLAPEDAPPRYAEVARLLKAASAQPAAHELAREAEVVAKVASAVRSSSNTHSPRRSFMPFALSRPRITAALVAAALACTIGLASASALPGAAQDIASEMLAKVGVSVSGPNDNAGTHPTVRGSSTTVTPSDAGKGSDISDLATSTELSGVEKGAAISSAASEGKSRAGTQGSAAGGSAPVGTPNTGGTGTADTASGGHSSAGSANAGTGQATADEASGGHSSDGQAHRP
jgi:hypothetical protein